MHTLVHLVQVYGYGLITVLVALECAGLLVPGETMFFGSAVYASTSGKLSILLVIGAASAGAIVGSLVGYWVGWLLGQKLLNRYGYRVGLTARRLTLVRYLFGKHGGKAVFIGRFCTGLRSFTPILAGASLMRWRVFLAWAIAGGVVWPCAHGAVAYLLGNAARRMSGSAGIALGVGTVIVVLIAFWFIKKNEARLTEAALRWEQHEEHV
jgi:membrane protein DedA with SNARE-associated domain